MDLYKSLCFDPGGSTGWSTYVEVDYDDNPIWSGGTLTENRHHLDFYNMICAFNPHELIIESFEFRQKAGSESYRKGLELVSREYIGIAQLYCDMTGTPIIQQSPSLKDTNIVRNENLEKLSLLIYPLHDNRHMHDAHKHHVYYQIHKRKVKAILDRIKST